MLDHERNLRIGQAAPSATPGVVVLATLTDLPTDGYTGQLVYISDADQFRIYDTDAWRTLGSGGGGGGGQIFVGSDQPATPAEGDGWLDPITKVFRVYGTTTGWVATIPDADYMNTIKIRGDQITTGTLAATESITVGSATGGGVSIGASPGGDLGIWGRAADGHNRFELPTDPAKPLYFEGNATIGNLTVNGKLTANTAVILGAGQSITMATGQTAPDQGPQVSIDYQTISFSGGTDSLDTTGCGFYNYGGSNSSKFVYLATHNGLSVTIRIYDYNGTYRGSTGWSAGSGTTSITLMGLTVGQSNNSLYLFYSRVLSGVKYSYTRVYSLSTPTSPTLSIEIENPAKSWFASDYTCAAATDGSIFSGTAPWIYLIGRNTSGKARIVRCGPAGDSATITDTQIPVGHITGAFACAGPGQGGDYSSIRYGFPSSNGVLAVVNSAGTEVISDEWDYPAQMGIFGGMWWDGSNFWLFNASSWTGYRMESDSSMRGWDPAGSGDDWYLATAWYSSSGGRLSTRSPYTIVQMKRRARLRISSQPFPSGGTYPITNYKIYLRVGSVPGSAPSMRDQGLYVSSQTTVLTAVDRSTAYNDPTSSTFGAGSGATQIRNDTGTQVIDATTGITSPRVAVAGNKVVIDSNGIAVDGVLMTGSAPPGAVMMFAGTTVPAGWLLCNGAGYSGSSYPNLATALGYSTSGTFYVPNLVNYFPIGAGGSYPLRTYGGATTATASATITSANLGSHTHSIANKSLTGANDIQAGTGSAGRLYYSTGNQNHDHGGATGYAAWSGYGSPLTFNINTLNPYYAINFIIKT